MTGKQVPGEIDTRMEKLRRRCWIGNDRLNSEMFAHYRTAVDMLANSGYDVGAYRRMIETMESVCKT